MPTTLFDAPPIDLAAGGVDIWHVCPEAIDDEDLLAGYAELLDDQEQQRRQRFIFERHRHSFLVSHALVRAMLSAAAESVHPARWRYETNEYGRPHIAADQQRELQLPPIRFNLSHTDGMATCAVVLGREVGVDVEDLRRRRRTVAIADRFFSPTEVRDLHQLPAIEQRDRFFDYWTLKESYIKARGYGLHLPLSEFSFHLEANRRVRISFGGIDDDPERWQFLLADPSPDHRLALAVDRGKGGQALKVRIRDVTPCVAAADE